MFSCHINTKLLIYLSDYTILAKACFGSQWGGNPRTGRGERCRRSSIENGRGAKSHVKVNDDFKLVFMCIKHHVLPCYT